MLACSTHLPQLRSMVYARTCCLHAASALPVLGVLLACLDTTIHTHLGESRVVPYASRRRCSTIHAELRGSSSVCLALCSSMYPLSSLSAITPARKKFGRYGLRDKLHRQADLRSPAYACSSVASTTDPITTFEDFLLVALIPARLPCGPQPIIAPHTFDQHFPE